ncbi:hypothetical protein IV44_GL000305 [Lactobacillus amylovorus DSM 16698]|uniref:Uncharacterized protein n=1 Tax=Lactobacillus amylovorus subsp. animalium DSM 16698 TaxID=695563 RepID=A0A0R2KR76_LACAM|nr:thiopeptide-type bacteriocin biosynthesis protein [Lactobacillus amylovorus]KRN92175.1 hypothetical protein IV44_GL000305 [Lactobacillus amylovorus DSM 16698]
MEKLIERSLFNYLRINKLKWEDLPKIDSILKERNCNFDILNNYSPTSKLLQLVALSNPSFYKFMKKQNVLNRKSRITLYNYAVRSIAKPVPLYGFASVANDVSINKYWIDIDSNWLRSLIKKFLPIANFMITNPEKVLISVNQNYLNSNQGYYYLFIDDSSMKKVIKSSIELTTFLNLLKIPITLDDFVKRISKDYDIDTKDIFDIVKSFLDKGIIIYDFNLKYANNIDKLMLLSNYFSKDLRYKIRELVRNIKDLTEHFSIKSYLKLQDSMEKFVNNDNQNCLNVISTENVSNLKNMDTIEQNILSFINWVDDTIYLNESKKISEYLIDRYGQNTFIPLSILLNDERFLDLYFSKRTDVNLTDTDNKILSFFQESKLNNNDNNNFIELSKFIPKTRNSGKPFFTSGELIFDSILDKTDHLTGITLNSQIGSNELGNLGGRFYSVLNRREDVEQYLLNTPKSKNFEFAKILYSFSDVKIENVDSRLDIPKYICLNKISKVQKDKYILIENVGIVIQNGRLCLFDSYENKEIVLTNLNAINPQNGNLLLQMLYYIGEQNDLVKKIEHLKYIHDKYIPNIPVKWKNIVLFPAIVKLNKDTVRHAINNKPGGLITFLQNELNTNISKFLFLDKFEYEFVDFSNEFSKHYFYETLKNNTNGTITFKKIEGELKGNSCQFIFGYNSKDQISIDNKEIQQLIDKRKKLNEVLYFKIFIHDYLQESYVNNQLKKLIKHLKAAFSEFSGASFVRYKDLEHHIRLRIFLNDKKRIEIEQYITDYLEKDPLVSKFEICEYFPEISRYGGLDGTDMYEKYSAKESDLLLKLTDYNDRNVMLYMALNITSIFKAEEHVNLVVSNYKAIPKEIKKKLRLEKANVLNEIQKINTAIHLDPNLNTLYNDWISELTRYSKFTKMLPPDKRTYILDSIIHMLCNRRLGIDRDKEKEAWIYLNSLLGFYKYNRKEE